MANKIKGNLEGAEIDVKRFYLPGIVVESKCPKCGHLHEVDMGSQYLSYPCVGDEEKINFYCEEGESENYCDTEWEVSIKLGMTVEIV